MIGDIFYFFLDISNNLSFFEYFEVIKERDQINHKAIRAPLDLIIVTAFDHLT